MLFVLEATKIDHHWASLKHDGPTRRRILAPAVALADFRDAATRKHAEQIKEPLQSSNAHWPIVYCQLGGLDDLEHYLAWATDRVKVRLPQLNILHQCGILMTLMHPCGIVMTALS